MPVPPLVEVTVTELFCTPPLIPVTFTENVQVAAAARVAPERLTDAEPAAAVMTPPPQEPVRPLGVETSRPPGRVSVKPTPVRLTVVFGLEIEKLRVVEAPKRMGVVPKVLVMEGGATTVSVAVLEVVPVPPSVDDTAPVVLFSTAAVDPVTFTEMVQLPLAAMVPPERLTEEAPAVAVGVPPQVLLKPAGVATINPAGSGSVKATPVKATAVFGFVMVKVRLVLPPSGMDAAPNALLIVAGAATVTEADALPPVPPSVDVMSPDTLFFTPAVAPVTWKISMQLELAASVSPLKLTTPGLRATVEAVQVPPTYAKG